MERSAYTPMAPSSEGPNPLRPYYRPPSIGVTPTTANTTPATASNPSFGSSARNILSDLNYNEFLGESAPTTGASFRSLVDQLVWKYSSVFMAQPFEVAKTVLQVRLAADAVGGGQMRALGARTPRSAKGARHQDYPSLSEDTDDEDDDDEPSYFTSSAPRQTSVSRTTSRQHPRSPPRSHSSSSQRSSPSSHTRPSAPTQQPPYKLDLRKPDSLTEVLSQLWSREGSWGIWKGTNVTFLYSLLSKTIETWMRSMLSAVLNLPDPGGVSLLGASGPGGGAGGLDIVDSPNPVVSLGVAVLAAGVAGLLLAPLDVVRTRLILTPTTHPTRTVLSGLRALATYFCPRTLLAPTLLHSTIPALFSGLTPLLLRSNLRIDPVTTPASYSLATFLSSTAELFTRLPVETVLRRGQVQVVQAGEERGVNKQVVKEGKFDTVVPTGAYTGVVSTMWHIAREEGETVAEPKEVKGPYKLNPNTKAKKGQGIAGLWRGWRVGWWGLVGVWGAAALGPVGGKGGEF